MSSLISWKNELDDRSFAYEYNSGSQAGEFPMTSIHYCLDPDPSLATVWTPVDNSPYDGSLNKFRIDVDFGDDRTIRLIGAFGLYSYSNYLFAGGTSSGYSQARFSVDLGTTLGGTDVANVAVGYPFIGNLYQPGNFFYDLGADYTARYIRFTFDSIGIPEYIQIRRLWAGAASTVDVSMNQVSVDCDDPSFVEWSRSGIPYPRTGVRRRVVSCTLMGDTNTEWYGTESDTLNLVKMDEDLGVTSEVCLLPLAKNDGVPAGGYGGPEHSRLGVYGRVTQSNPSILVDQGSSTARHVEKQITVREIT